MDLKLELPPTVESPARARHFVERALVERCPPPLVEAASLLASELVTNAVCHARTDLTVSVDTSRDGVRVEVSDQSPEMPTVRAPTHTGSGRGLMLVERIARAWGAEERANGKVVWIELTPRATEAAFGGSARRPADRRALAPTTWAGPSG